MASTSQSEPSPETRQSEFEQAVAYSLHLWPALSLAVQNNWGGPDSADKRDWLAGAVVDMYPSFADLAKNSSTKKADTTTNSNSNSTSDEAAAAGGEPDIEDVETTLLQVLDDEFEVVVDDETGFECAENIVRARAACAKGDFAEVEALRRRWAAGRGKKVALPEGKAPDQETDDEDEDEDDEDAWESDHGGGGDVDMDDAPPLVRAQKDKPPPPEVDEDGFTKVTRKR